MDKLSLPLVIVAFGLAIGGWFIGHGFVESRTVDRFVTVKGVAERDVVADLALWPLQVVATADNPATAQRLIDESVSKVQSFLERNGIDGSLMEAKGIEVTDRLANQYDSGGRGGRYIVQQRLMVRSEDPAIVHAASQNVGELVADGVILKSGQGWGPAVPTYLFKNLNDLKPSMIEEATASAREAAQRFADDSESQVDGIRRANQGVFVILARDGAGGIVEEQELHKTVRVVVTIEYYLG
ncbi:MAG: SIMPL domain-containing protein [Rhodothermales bacterium]|nr:SIMPL domain-containing protein [Rhodothermales bacterium]